MRVVTVCVVLLSFFSAYCVRIETIYGELEGSSYFTNNGKEIFTFLGVPYAKPPVGKYRFEEPKPAKNWSGIWPAYDYSSACIQFDIFSSGGVTGNEDCLYLNIFTPTVNNNSNLPVLVFIYGGAFMVGESKFYNPKLLLENHDIIYVSINYRLGPFGFLSTQDNVVPGNNGLKDQVLALKWVQENIGAFGGDKSKVTIAGNSAGGASVHLHYLSPLSQGLFDKGISSSGSALVPWALTEEPLQKAKVLADSVGCPTNATDIMVKCLKQRPSKLILSKLHPLFMPWLSNPFSPFGPVVENSTRNPFLPRQPYQLLSQGHVYDGPWLASVTTEEGIFPAAMFLDQEELMQELNNDWYSIAPHLLDFNYTVPTENFKTMTDKIKEYYFENEEISEKTQDKVIEMLSDRLFSAGMGRTARLQASLTSSPVFFYTFGYRGKMSLSLVLSKSKSYYGVSHFDDMFYITSPTRDWAENLETEDDINMALTMTNMWANFIKTGNPSPSENIQWDPVSQDSTETGDLAHLLITSHNKMVMTKTNNFYNDQFWNSLHLNENEEASEIQTEIKDEL